jgi:phosphoglycolate phosphatase-like HAD superfamily hydrolase
MEKASQMQGGASPAPKLNVIFDFDGTIANTLPIVIELVEKWSVSDTKLTVELVEELRGMSAQQALKRVGIPLRKVPSLITQGRKELLEKLSDAQPFPDILEVIRELSNTCNLYVMSSNSGDNINRFLHNYKVSQYFKKVYGNVSVFGKTKVLKRIIKHEKLDKDLTVYVGDETRDIEAAHKINLRIISVVWGYNNEQIISQYHPDYMIDQPKELLTILKPA